MSPPKEMHSLTPGRGLAPEADRPAPRPWTCSLRNWENEVPLFQPPVHGTWSRQPGYDTGFRSPRPLRPPLLGLSSARQGLQGPRALLPAPGQPHALCLLPRPRRTRASAAPGTHSAPQGWSCAAHRCKDPRPPPAALCLPSPLTRHRLQEEGGLALARLSPCPVCTEPCSPSPPSLHPQPQRARPRRGS